LFVTRLGEVQSDEMINRLEQISPMKELSGRESLGIPLNVAEWVDADLLKTWVIEEVETLDWANPELQKYLQAHPDFRPKDLLCLLIYAYATSLLESEEIVGALLGQGSLRDLWRGPGPSAKEIGKFRKENRALLKWGLVQVLRRALQQKFQLGDIRFPSGLRKVLIDSATERLELARHMDRAAQGA
jgi:hypothetical protein